jgi:hypothetical protein
MTEQEQNSLRNNKHKHKSKIVLSTGGRLLPKLSGLPNLLSQHRKYHTSTTRKLLQHTRQRLLAKQEHTGRRDGAAAAGREHHMQIPQPVKARQ